MKPSDRFDSLIRYYAERVALPFDLVKRQMMAESSGNPKAESPAGAMGLLQLMPLTAKELGVTDPLNPDENLRGGTEYLARQVANVKVTLAHSTVPESDIYRMALGAYKNASFGYTRETLRNIANDELPQTWANFAEAFKHVTFRGRTPRWQESLAYAEKILPPAPPEPQPS